MAGAKNPAFGDDENSMSARSVAVIAKNLVNDFLLEILKILSLNSKLSVPMGSGTTKMQINLQLFTSRLLLQHEGVTV